MAFKMVIKVPYNAVQVEKPKNKNNESILRKVKFRASFDLFFRYFIFN